MDAEKPFDNVIANEAVRPKCDIDAERSIDNETTRGAVRPKSDTVENKNEYDAARSKCDDEAAAVDEDATNKQEKDANEVAAAKKMKFRMKMWMLKKGGTLQGERNNT